MLNCRDVTKLTGDLIDGRLPWRTKMQMKLHLLICHHCRRFVRQFRATTEVVWNLETDIKPTPDEVKQQVACLLEEQKKQ